MIRSLGLGIDATRLESTCQPFGDKDEIEAFGLTDEIHPVDAHRGGMRLIGVQHRPGVEKAWHAIAERGKDAGSLGRPGGEVHVAAQQRLRGPGEHLEGAALFFDPWRAH